jgi:RNA polymerase sigma-70 factor, ECF subfamily
MISDEELMVSAAHGDACAFEQIVLRYQASVWRIAYRYLWNSADAQDITQIAFLKLFEAAPRYRPTALLKTYLFRIVNTTCIDHVRKKKSCTSDDPEEIPEDSPSVIDSMILLERDRAVRLSIGKLPMRQRSAIILRYETGLSVCEIANILKVTEKAVERLLARGREALSIIFKEK